MSKPRKILGQDLLPGDSLLGYTEYCSPTEPVFLDPSCPFVVTAVSRYGDVARLDGYVSNPAWCDGPATRLVMHCDDHASVIRSQSGSLAA